MNIWANKGYRVRCYTLSAGNENHQKIAEQYLTLDAEYTVEYTEVSSWKTYVFLQEIPGVGFNSVFFVDVEGQDNDDESHPDWERFKG